MALQAARLRDLRDATASRLADCGVPLHVAVDDRVDGRRGVRDDRRDHLVVVRPAEVVAGIGRVGDRLPGNALHELVGPARYRRVERDRVVPLLGWIDLAVDRGRRDETGQVVRQEGGKGFGQSELDGIGVDLLHLVELAQSKPASVSRFALFFMLTVITTSLAVIGEPSVHFASVRIFTVQILPSLDTDGMLVARSGWMLRFLSA